MTPPLDQLWEVGRIAVAMVLGGLVGYERELSNKPAGIRTHMLVAAGAALFLELGTLIAKQYAAYLGSDVLNLDPSRILVAVIMGVSFLGAGTIVRDPTRGTEGLTTAASTLMTAAIGVSVAVSQWILAGGVTLLTLLTLRTMHLLDKRVSRKRANPKLN